MIQPKFHYGGSGTPENLAVDRGVQRLAMLVMFAALKDKYDTRYKFIYSPASQMRLGRWKGLHDNDGERWENFKVSREEVEEFEETVAFDWWVALMGGDIELWHRIFKSYNKDSDAKEMLAYAALKLKEA